ncbi:hypothetical protein HNR50_003539 [Spirochaeta isovalerica]|uniref:Uncharacterized protein n=1 Tax=Spirochaeta isovalerica TaxID=150 RepID=A0A841RH60_9SPIO|nr:hypothetical protein [Spirochaeta isovalerica]
MLNCKAIENTSTIVDIYSEVELFLVLTEKSN